MQGLSVQVTLSLYPMSSVRCVAPKVLCWNLTSLRNKAALTHVCDLQINLLTEHLHLRWDPYQSYNTCA